MRILLTFSFILTSFLSIGQDKAYLLDSVFSVLFQQKKFNGNVLIAEKGIPVFMKSYGLADESSGRQLNTETVFELASVSKQFTAMAILLLEKQGKLEYEDKLSKYFPELAFYEGITIDHLVHHTSGLPDYMDLLDSTFDKSRIAVNDDIIKNLAKHKPVALFEPGYKFWYSNTGYALLGSIIERVSGKTFGEFLRESIFIPLDMKNTRVYRSRYKPEVIPNYALGHVNDSTGKLVLPDSFGENYYSYYLDGIVGDGMVNSNLSDLLKWDRALYSSKIIDDNDRKRLFAGTLTSNGMKSSYGFGWLINEKSNYGKYINHSGSWAGYLTYIERHLENDKTIIILQNNLTRKSAIPVEEIKKILYNEKLEEEKLVPVKLNAADLEKYIGVYSSDNFPVKLKVYMQNDSLFAIPSISGQSGIYFESYKDHVFVNEAEEIKLSFDPLKATMLLKRGSRSPVLLIKE